ncbi:MAG: hypothetical protein HKN47_03800 [Pirellulaceae bacterium]|nr:hypothetical protein [Pirellulaceae bacterium]
MKSFGICVCIIALSTFAGCGSQSDVTVDAGAADPVVQSQRERLVLATEPPDSKTPTEAKELAAEPTDLVLAGRIDAGEIDPFKPGMASFMISQLPEEGHGADDPDHAENCKFCARRLANAPKVIVEFKDDDGETLAIDSQQLFGVQKGDVVLVRGKVRYQEATNTVHVDGDGLYRQQ